MQSSGGSVLHRQPKDDGHQSRQLARAKLYSPKRLSPHPRPGSRNVRRPTVPLTGLRRHRVDLHRSRSVLSRNRYSKRQKIRQAFRMRWHIICTGSVTPIGSSTAPLFISMRPSTTRRFCPGYRASECPDQLQVSISSAGSSGAIVCQRDISKRSCRIRHVRFTVMISVLLARLSGAGSHCTFRMTSAVCPSPSAKRSSIGCAG